MFAFQFLPPVLKEHGEDIKEIATYGGAIAAIAMLWRQFRKLRPVADAIGKAKQIVGYTLRTLYVIPADGRRKKWADRIIGPMVDAKVAEVLVVLGEFREQLIDRDDAVVLTLGARIDNVGERITADGARQSEEHRVLAEKLDTFTATVQTELRTQSLRISHLETR